MQSEYELASAAVESALVADGYVLAADLSSDPPVPLGSTLAYALASMRNYVQMAIFQGATEDQVFDVVVDGIDAATRAGAGVSAGAPPRGCE